ncbi:MAG: proline racemase family protein [Steroidobacteraceae bacterium]
MAFFTDEAWQAPATWRRIKTIEMHTGGEPLRVITSGLPPIEGRTVLEKRRYFREHYDHLRTGLIWEPRGHADMYGAVVMPSETADFDVFFLHNEGYSTMCGHAIIALTTLALQTDAHPKDRDVPEFTINVPAGTVHSRGVIEGGRVREVLFRNVPSFAYLQGRTVEVAGLGQVRFDIAYGGAFYAIIEAAPLGLALRPEEYGRLIDHGRRIKRAVMEQFPIAHPSAHPTAHPTESDLSLLYGTIFTGPPMQPGHHSRNVTVFADGEIDRSATGTGVSARAALLHAQGELRKGEKITIESLLGSTMTVRCVEESRLGPYTAIIPEVSGTAHVIGRSEFCFDPDDPLNSGFFLR